MFGRFTATKRIAEAEAAAAAHAAAPFAAPPPLAEPPMEAPSLQTVAELPKVETTESAPSITPLRDKLLDAKVRLHRRLIEEINLSAIEKVSEGEVRRQISALVAQYVMAERIALNTQELEDFVDEIIDEMTGLGPIEPLLKDPSDQRHPDQRPRMRLCRAPRHARADAGALQGRAASAAHRQQDRLGGRTARR